ncbi:MAG: nitrilase-related carbon-nitrogen hydrolase, partial [Novosphingobium sp.]
MADQLIITLAQLNQKVGDLAANAAAMLATRAAAQGSDLIVFPEMQLIGYPAEDLVQKPALIERSVAEMDRLAKATADGGPAMLVGSVFIRDGALHNGVALLEGGRIVATRFKHELPNYGTFDEKRLILPGPLPEPVAFRGVLLGLPICEDIWHPEVCRHLAEMGAEIFISVNG